MFTPTKYAYATANPFDNATTNNTYSFTYSGGASATVAVVYLQTDGTSCSVTYGGVTMKQEVSSNFGGSTNYIGYYLAGIAGGSQTIASSCSGRSFSNTYVVTYTGGPYSDWAESVGSASKPNGVGTTLNIPLTTVADNVIGTSFATNGGVAFIAASGMTFRASYTIAAIIEDNTNLFTPAGTLNMAWDNNGNTTNIEGIAIGIALSTSTPAVASFLDQWITWEE